MPSNIAKSLSRLSRDKLLSLCVSWAKSSKCDPYLSSTRNILESAEEDYLHEPAETRSELRGIYKSCQDSDSDSDLHDLSKRDIIDRIIDGDWRRGLTHTQLAQIDFAALEENDTSLRWTALKLVPLHDDGICKDAGSRPVKRRKVEPTSSNTVNNNKTLPRYPQTTPALFIQNLKSHIAPLVKAHYHIHRLSHLNLSIVRLYIAPNAPFAPLNTNIPRQNKTATDAGRIMYIALPDSCPYVYISVSGSAGSNAGQKNKAGAKSAAQKVDMAGIKKIVLEAIPKALSRPQQRWSLETTRLTAKSLEAMCLLRGGGKVGSTGGAGVSNVAVSKGGRKDDQTQGDSESQEEQQHLVRRREVEQCFGSMAGGTHAKLDRVQLKIKDLCASRVTTKSGQKRKRAADSDEECTPITVTLSGTDVFAGLKDFAMRWPDLVDLKRLPGALTGEGGRSTIVL